MCRVIFCVKECLLWPVCSLDKTVSLFPALFCTPRPNLPVILGIFWFPTYTFQSPMMKRTCVCVCVCVCMLILEDVTDLHSTSQLLLLQHQCLGHRLGLLWCWMLCLGNEPRSFCCFWGCTQVLHFGLLLTMRLL